MSNALKLSGALILGKLATAPSNPTSGMSYYDTTLSKYRRYDGSTWQETTDAAILAASTGAAAIGIADGSGQFAGTTVEAALDEAMDAAQAAQATADAAGVADDTAYNATSWDANSDPATKNAIRDKFEADKLLIDANTAKVSADGLVTTHSDVSSAGSGSIISTAERSKLGGIEALADVTDSTNVDAAGAVMESDTSTASMSFVIDEDGMGSDSDTKVPTQQSVKAFITTEIAAAVASEASFKGDYNASTNSPDLDTSPIATAIGDMYVVTVAGNFFSTAVEVGDTLIAKQATATLESHWTIVNRNLDDASIKVAYENNADTNALTDSEKTAVGNLSGTNTGDEAAASTSVAGIIELATLTETNTGTATNRAVTPAGLATIQSDVDANTAKVSYSAATAKADVVNDSITDGNLDTAPSENAVFDALALKADTGSVGISNVVEDTTPQLGGDLDINNKALEDATNDILIAPNSAVKRSKQASKTDFIQEEYIHSITLAASQTDTVISALTFAHATFEGLEITYKLKEATTNNVRIGTIRVATNGTTVVLNDMSTETADLGVSFSAVVSAANINIRFTSDTNIVTMRADAKFIKA